MSSKFKGVKSMNLVVTGVTVKEQNNTWIVVYIYEDGSHSTTMGTFSDEESAIKKANELAEKIKVPFVQVNE